MRNRPPIEIPMDWSNEKAEAARVNNGSLGLEMWGNRRMIRADPAFAPDLREYITSKREDPSEQAWSVGPLLKWISAKQVEKCFKEIAWAIEIVLGTYRVTLDGVDMRMLRVKAKVPPSRFAKNT